MLKLCRVIGIGASSVVYQAKEIKATDKGSLVSREYPGPFPSSDGRLDLPESDQYQADDKSYASDESSMDEGDPDEAEPVGFGDEEDRAHVSDRNGQNEEEEGGLDPEEEQTFEHEDSAQTNETADGSLDRIPERIAKQDSSKAELVCPTTPTHLSQRAKTGTSPLTGPVERMLTVKEARLVVKFARDSEILRNEAVVESLLPRKFKVGWEKGPYHLCRPSTGPIEYDWMNSFSGDALLVGQLHRPLVPGVFSLNYAIEIRLERQHLMHLLQNLEHIHKLGYVHRDLRVQNLLWSRSIGRFLLADFGFVVRANMPRRFAGTIETASMRILELLIAGESQFAVYVEDDYESFLKMIKMGLYSISLPARFGLTEKEYYQAIYHYWANDDSVRSFLALGSGKDKLNYLRRYCHHCPDYNSAFDLVNSLTSRNALAKTVEHEYET